MLAAIIVVALKGMFKQIMDFKQAWKVSKLDAVSASFKFYFIFFTLALFCGTGMCLSDACGFPLSGHLGSHFPVRSLGGYRNRTGRGPPLLPADRPGQDEKVRVFSARLARPHRVIFLHLYFYSLGNFRPRTFAMGNVPCTDVYLDVKKFKAVSKTRKYDGSFSS